MAIEGFDYKAFAKDLAGQANGVIPPDISDADKQYIINLIFNFCNMSGEALYNDTNSNFTADQAMLITQFIGEWAFHKSIDAIKTGIEPQYRDGLMQKIAFTVFEIAKQAVIKNLDQSQMITLVEHHVKKTYDQAIAELQKNGAITEEMAQKAKNQSNIDDMAQQMQEEAAAQMSDNKILKLASFAVVLQKLPKEKAMAIIDKFNPDDANVILQYMQMSDLDQKLDKSIIKKCLDEVKNTLPKPKKSNPDRIFFKLCKIVKNSNFEKVLNIIKDERPFIQEYVQNAKIREKTPIPAKVAEIIVNHIEEKIS